MNELAQAVSQYGLEALLQHTHAVIVTVYSDGTIISCNPAFDSIRKSVPLSSAFEDYLPSEDRGDFRRRLKIACESGVQVHWVLELIIDDQGSELSYDALLLPAGAGTALLFAEQAAHDPQSAEVIEKLSRQVKLFRHESERAKKIALRKQTEVEAVLAQAQEVSDVDSLTFLPNRRQIVRRLQDEVLRAQRYNTLFSISVVDLDLFKRINDGFGHAAGDHVLREVAILLRNSIRDPDVVGRYGGEEFLILLPNSSAQAASVQATRLCQQMRQSVIHADEHEIQVTLSIGIAQFQNGVDTWQTLLSRADTAMYEAKRSGRDRWATSDTTCPQSP